MSGPFRGLMSLGGLGLRIRRAPESATARRPIGEDRVDAIRDCREVGHGCPEPIKVVSEEPEPGVAPWAQGAANAVLDMAVIDVEALNAPSATQGAASALGLD